MKILVTGAFGWTAKSILEALKEAGHEIVALDLKEVEVPDYFDGLVSEIVRGTVTDAALMEKSCEGVDAIIHLAVAIGKDDYKKAKIPFQTNALGTYNVMKAALDNKVKKVILMSSAPVHLMDRIENKLDAMNDYMSSDDEDHLYDLTKRLQEDIGKDFAKTYGLNVVTLRAGHIVDGRTNKTPSGSGLTDEDYCRGGWVCRYDLANACVKAIEYENEGYDAFYVIGAEIAKEKFDVERAEEVLGIVYERKFEDYN